MSSPITKALPSLFLWQALSVITGFLTQVVLARALGPHDKGIVDLFLLIPLVTASVLDFGLLSANTFFAGKGTLDLKILHSNTLVWSIGASLLALVVGIGWSSFAGSPFPALHSYQFLLAVLIVLPSLYFSLWSGLMYGSDHAESVYRVTGIVSLISLFAYGFAIVAGTGLIGILYLSVGLAFLKGIVPLLLTARLLPLQLYLDRIALRQSIRYGIALFVGIAINTLHVRVSQFLVESMLGPAELGFYALAVRIAEMVWLLDFVVINASIFRITSSSLSESAKITQQMTRMIGLMVTALAIGVALASPILLPLVFGSDFSPAVRPLLLLLPGIIAWSLSRSVAQFISYQVGKPWYNTSAAGFAFLVNILASLLLIPALGIEGAALAAVLSYFCNLVILTLIFRKLSNATMISTFIPQREDIKMMKDLLTNTLRLIPGRNQ